MAVKDWSTTASSNATADSANGIQLSEGMNPGQLNDSMRALMAVIKGDLANSLAANGFQKLPNGLILQWGTAPFSGTDTTVTYPLTFPNAVLSVVITPLYAVVALSRLVSISIDTVTSSNFNARARYADNGGTVGVISTDSYWMAIGY